MFFGCGLACGLPFKRFKSRKGSNGAGPRVVCAYGVPEMDAIQQLYILSNLSAPYGDLPKALKRDEIFEPKVATLGRTEGCT
jgi:hypothetical protein